jgi:nicotinamide riboside kinase
MAASDERACMKIALLGAESTGKTQLSHELAEHVQSIGENAIAIDEYLRVWCEQHARTPRQDEQQHIAHIQRTRIEAAAQKATWVFADTTPLMTAIYSEFIFQDTSLTTAALAYQNTFDLTLITGLDMPWQADGIQRDGEHVRAPVDALLRQHLQTAGIAFEVIYGSGEQRTFHALQAIARQSQSLNTTNSIASRVGNTPDTEANDLKKWQWHCEKCSDPDCEHRLFQLLG